jgi:hypothetical protein
MRLLCGAVKTTAAVTLGTLGVSESNGGELEKWHRAGQLGSRFRFNFRTRRDSCHSHHDADSDPDCAGGCLPAHALAPSRLARGLRSDAGRLLKFGALALSPGRPSTAVTVTTVTSGLQAGAGCPARLGAAVRQTASRSLFGP